MSQYGNAYTPSELASRLSLMQDRRERVVRVRTSQQDYRIIDVVVSKDDLGIDLIVEPWDTKEGR